MIKLTTIHLLRFRLRVKGLRLHLLRFRLRVKALTAAFIAI